MTIYLVRHGKARKGGKDKLRPLTQRGRRETQAAAKFLSLMGVEPAAIWHSDRVRAQQTARILKSLHPRQGLIEQPDMGPEDPVAPMMRAIERCKGEVIIVGHLPHLGTLISNLLNGGKWKDGLRITPSTIVVLRREEGKWSIQAVIPPPLTAAGRKRVR